MLLQIVTLFAILKKNYWFLLKKKFKKKKSKEISVETVEINFVQKFQKAVQIFENRNFSRKIA